MVLYCFHQSLIFANTREKMCSFTQARYIVVLLLQSHLKICKTQWIPRRSCPQIRSLPQQHNQNLYFHWRKICLCLIWMLHHLVTTLSNHLMFWRLGLKCYWDTPSHSHQNVLHGFVEDSIVVLLNHLYVWFVEKGKVTKPIY